MLEIDLNLERRMTTHQDVEKILFPYQMLYSEKAVNFQTVLDALFFYFTKKHIFYIFYKENYTVGKNSLD